MEPDSTQPSAQPPSRPQQPQPVPPVQPTQPPMRPIPVPTVQQILKMSQKAKQSAVVIQQPQQPQLAQRSATTPTTQLPPKPQPPLQPTQTQAQPPTQTTQPPHDPIHTSKAQPTVNSPQPRQHPTPVSTNPKQEPELTPLQKRLLERIKVNAASKKKKKRTILVVIFMIGVVAASYGGWSFYQKSTAIVHKYTSTSKISKAAMAESNANDVLAYVQKFFKEKGYYPSSAADFTGSSTNKLSSDIKVVTKHSDLNSTNGDSAIVWECVTTCDKTTGGRISYWDFKTNAVSTDLYYVGTAKSSSTFVSATVASTNPTSTPTPTPTTTPTTTPTPTPTPTKTSSVSTPTPTKTSTSTNTNTAALIAQRDTIRRGDLLEAISEVISYQSAHKGALPTDWATFEANYLIIAGNDPFIDPLGAGSTYPSATSYVFTSGHGSSLTSSFSSSTRNIMYYDTAYICLSSSGGITKSSSKRVALRMYLEAGGHYCLNN